VAKRGRAAEALLRADAVATEAARPNRQTLPVRALEHLADLGDQPQMRVLCGSVILVGLIGGDRRLARAGLRMLAAHTLATWAKDFVKHRVDRNRPRSAHGSSGGHRPAPGRSKAKEKTSFPSGHSAGAAAVAAAFSRDYPERTVPALVAGGALALAQIPRCAHYPTDVGAGLAIGFAAEAVVDSAFRLAQERLTSARPPEGA
jgi:undecaprenyl-diphosphatase